MDSQRIITINQDRDEMTVDLIALEELSGGPADDSSIEAITVPIETRTIDSAAIFNGKEKTFDDHGRQSRYTDSLRAVWVGPDDSIRTLDLLSSHDDAPPVMNGRWDWVIAPGVFQKVIRSRPSTNVSSKVVKIRVDRQAIIDAENNSEVLYIFEYEDKNGGNERSEWDSATIERATRLIHSD
jgi:hypothetical protein